MGLLLCTESVAMQRSKKTAVRGVAELADRRTVSLILSLRVCVRACVVTWNQ